MNPIVNLSTFMEDAEISCSNNKTVPWTYGQSFYFSVSIITTVGKITFFTSSKPLLLWKFDNLEHFL